MDTRFHEWELRMREVARSGTKVVFVSQPEYEWLLRQYAARKRTVTPHIDFPDCASLNYDGVAVVPRTETAPQGTGIAP
ncbi:MAG: hypothetical protein L0Z53_00275 [Acidobacteriales bacterium]|nr:hypothetical protein [Terriglobales bacterium]